MRNNNNKTNVNTTNVNNTFTECMHTDWNELKDFKVDIKKGWMHDRTKRLLRMHMSSN